MEKPRIHPFAGKNYVQLFIEISAKEVAGTTARSPGSADQCLVIKCCSFSSHRITRMLAEGYLAGMWKMDTEIPIKQRGHKYLLAPCSSLYQISGCLSLIPPGLGTELLHFTPTPSHCHIAQLHLSAHGVGLCLTQEGKENF